MAGGGGCHESAAKSSTTEEEDLELGALHLKHLVRFVETEYNDVPARDRRMKDEKRAPWDMLSKGTKVGYYCKNSGELLCGVVASSTYNSCYDHIESCCGIVLDVWNFDGIQYKACQIERHIKEYQGERDFAHLPVLPVQFLGDPSTLDAKFLAKGKKYYELAVASTNRFMHYQGMMFQEGYETLCKERSDGRVMIDFMSFMAMNPSEYSCLESKRLRGLEKRSTCWIDGRLIYKPVEVSDESLIFAPAIVYGFSFALKEWGSFAVSGFSDITFDTEAFEEVILDPSMKGLVHDLVSQYIYLSADKTHSIGRVPSVERLQTDPVSRNEKNCVFLCYGPPGTGKTLTAESIAETMRRPIWTLNASDLGAHEYDSKELESKLEKVLRIATNWQAVLMLDEADVLLEEFRSHSATFFRLLECYRGVLFLATNSINKIDVRSRSQITLLLHYPELSLKNKRKIWHALLTRMNVKGVSFKFCEEIATEKLNGHDIRNAIHIAQVFARSNGEALAVRHLKYVSDTLAHSLGTFTEKTDRNYKRLTFGR